MADYAFLKQLKSAPINLSATGTVIAAQPGFKIRVYAVKLVASAAVSVNFRDGASTALEGPMAVAQNGGFIEFVTPPRHLFETSQGNSLDLVISGVGNVGGRVSYWLDDAV